MSGPADLILRNGAIYTMDPLRRWVQALAVRGAVLVAVGDEAEIAAHAGPATEVIDLSGRTVLPGIVDVHNHHTRGGQADLYELSISPVMSFEDILAAVRKRAEATPEGEWVYGGIWGSTLIPRLSLLESRHALDAVSLDHPVMLRDDSQHNRWVNTVALARIGIIDATADPIDGRIVRDAGTGEAVGLLFEMASALAERCVAKTVTDAAGRDINSTRRAVEILNSYGVTAYQDANTMLPFLQALASLDAAGGLNAWCVASLPALETTYGPQVYGDALLARREEFRSRHVRPDFVKLFMDGVPTMRSAAMIEPYSPDPSIGYGFRGETLITVPELVRWIAKAEKLGMGIKIHCAGDGAVRAALDAIDVVRGFHGPGPLHQIAHAGYIDPADIPRFKALNVVADLCPIIWYPSPIVEAIMAVVPEERAKRYWPFRDLLESGALMAAGSDWPVIPAPDPWLGIEGMVTRRNPNGRYPHALWPEQALELADVLAIYTINAARAMGLGDITGSLEVGKSADMIVIDRNPFEIASDELADIRVLTTFFEGRAVFRREMP